MAQRILGFGDVVQLVEDARRVVKAEEAEELQNRLLSNTFNLNDFLKHISAVKKMGSMKDLLKMVPGMGAHVDDMGIEDKEILQIEAIIQSMTAKERQRPEILNTSRRDRIARGSGVTRVDVDGLLKQFQSMKKFMDQFSRGGGKGPMGKVKDFMNAKRQMADIGGMMNKMVEATSAPPSPKQAGGGPGKPRRGPPAASRDDIRKKRKMERQNRRKNRKR
jgi:signal recognition particle subunit SRP54